MVDSNVGKETTENKNERKIVRIETIVPALLQDMMEYPKQE